MHLERADNHTWRKIKSALASTIAFVSAILVIAPLGLVFFHLLVNGAGSVNWDFFTKLPAPVGAVGGGMANAIVGSLKLLALASVIGIPVGVLGGVYLAEYGSTRINSILRFLPTFLTEFLQSPGVWLFTVWLSCVSKGSRLMPAVSLSASS